MLSLSLNGRRFDIRRSSNSSAEREFENALRPLQFGDFSGQLKVVENLKVFVEAAKYRASPSTYFVARSSGIGEDHAEQHHSQRTGRGFQGHVRPGIGQAGRFGRYPDFAGAERRALHRRNPQAQSRSEEYLYSAMEDYRIDIMIDKGPSARSIQLDLNPFTLVGATTRSGLLTAPLRARFGINLHLEYYDAEVLSRIVERSAHILSVPIEHDAAMEIAGRSRGTPRIANALLRRVRDFARCAARDGWTWPSHVMRWRH